MIEDDNHHNNHATRGAEGPFGNFSNVCRRSVRQLAQLLQDDQVDLAELGVPHRIFVALSSRSLMTLSVENFFVPMRARWPIPYSLQYASNHSLAILVQAARTRRYSSGFVFFTGPQGSDRHYTDAKSVHSKRFGTIYASPSRCLWKGARRSSLPCASLQHLFKQVRQHRVTDKAKEKVATRLNITYAPLAVSIPDDPTLQSLDEHNSTEGSRGTCVPSEVQLKVLYRTGDIEGVNGGRAGLCLHSWKKTW